MVKEGGQICYSREIEHCPPCTEATPSREGVASLGGEWREAGEEGGRAASLPPLPTQGGSVASLGGEWRPPSLPPSLGGE